MKLCMAIIMIALGALGAPLDDWYLTHTNAPATNAAPVTLIMLTWSPYTNEVIRIEGNTNGPGSTNWFFVTNVTMVLTSPTWVVVPNAGGKEFFRACTTNLP